MSSIRTIHSRSISLASVNRYTRYDGVNALEAAGINTVQDLTYGKLINTQRFGKTSVEYLAIALADEVQRLQAIVDAVYAALDAKPSV